MSEWFRSFFLGFFGSSASVFVSCLSLSVLLMHWYAFDCFGSGLGLSLLPIPSSSVAPCYLSARVVNPSTPLNITGQSSGVVTRIPSAPYTSSPFM